MSDTSQGSNPSDDDDSSSVHSTRRNILRSSALLAVLSSGAATGAAGRAPVSPADVTDADWTMWRFNRANTGFNPQIGQVDELEMTWDSPYTPDNQVGNLYSPSVADGTVYYGTFDEQMHAIDAETGEEQWTAEVGDIIQSSPTVLNGSVYSGSHDGNIYAWDAETGIEEWSITGGGAGNRHTSVTVSQDQSTIYIGSDQICFSLVPETGEINWTFESPNNFVSTPTLSGGRVYIGSGAPEDAGDGYLHALDDQGGNVEEIWTRYFPDANVRSTAAVSDGSIFVGTLAGSSIDPNETTLANSEHDTDRDTYGVTAKTSTADVTGSVWSLDADTGDVNWTYDGGGVFSSPAVADNKVFVGVRGGSTSELVALDQITGDVVWSFEMDGFVTASPAYAAGQVYIGGGAPDSRVYVIDAASGDPVAQTQLNGSVYSPAVTNDGVYVANDDTEIYSLTPEASPQGISGTVTDFDGDPVSDCQVVVFERSNIYKPLRFISESLSGEPSVPDSVASTVTGSDGEYEILGLESGVYVGLLIPPTNSEFSTSLMGSVRAPIVVDDNIVARNATLDGRPLQDLEPVFEELFDIIGDPRERNTETLFDKHTARVAEVSVEGASEFDAIESGVGRVADTVALLDTGLAFDADMDPEDVHDTVAGDTLSSSVSYNYNGLPRAIRNIFDQLDEEQQEVLAAVATAMVDEEWVKEQIYGAGETAIETFLESTDFYIDPADAVAADEAEVTELTTIQPAEEFDLSVVEDRIEYFIDQFDGKGIPGAVITPFGTIYHYEQTEAQARSFENTQTAVDAIETADRIAQVTQAIGKGLMATGKGAPVGALLWGAGQKADTATDLAEPLARLKMALDWGLTLVHWGIDLQDMEKISNEMVEWLNLVIEEGVEPVSPEDINVKEVDLQLVESRVRTDYVTANVPEDPAFASSVPGLGDSRRARRPAIVTLENTSSEPVDVRIAMYDIRSDAETYGNGASLSPSPELSPHQLGAGETRDFFIQYETAPFNPVDTHEMITSVFVDGQILTNSEPQTFNVLLPVPIIGSDGTPDRQYYALTSDSKRADQQLTRQEEEELEPTTSTVIDMTLTPENSTAESTFVTASDTDNVLITHLSDGVAAIRVFDEQGRSVGYNANRDEVVNQIPDATYSGPNTNPEFVSLPEGPDRTLTVEVDSYKFVTGDPTGTSIRVTEIPEREALLSVSPGTTSAVFAPGETTSVQLELSEMGRQVGIENGTLSPTTFENDAGTTLPDGVDIELSRTTFGLNPDSSITLDVSFTVDTDVSLPAEESSRFEGDIEIDTNNAGSITATVSLLALDTDREDLSLTTAVDTVSKIRVLDSDPDEFALSERPPGMTPTDSMSVVGGEEGEVRVAVDRIADLDLEGYVHTDGSWTRVPLESRDDKLEIVFEDVAQLPADGTGASLLIGETKAEVYAEQVANENAVVDTESLRSAVDDWRNDVISREWLETVGSYWESGNPVR